MTLTLLAVKEKREQFMLDSIDTHHGMPHLVCRSNLYNDCFTLYEQELATISILSGLLSRMSRQSTLEELPRICSRVSGS